MRPLIALFCLSLAPHALAVESTTLRKMKRCMCCCSTKLAAWPTTLPSHLIDLSGAIAPSVSYARWFYNQAPDIDRLTVEVSNDNGTTWKIVEVVPHTDGWVLKHWRIADFVVPTAAMRLPRRMSTSR